MIYEHLDLSTIPEYDKRNRCEGAKKILIKDENNTNQCVITRCPYEAETSKISLSRDEFFIFPTFYELIRNKTYEDMHDSIKEIYDKPLTQDEYETYKSEKKEYQFCNRHHHLVPYHFLKKHKQTFDPMMDYFKIVSKINRNSKFAVLLKNIEEIHKCFQNKNCSDLIQNITQKVSLSKNEEKLITQLSTLLKEISNERNLQEYLQQQKISEERNRK